jgi:hypothetical protein
LPDVADPFATSSSLAVSKDGVHAMSDLVSPTIGLALSGRQIGNKRALLGAYGGTKLTQDSVKLGLRWLEKNQQKNGSWSLLGPYPHGGPVEDNIAATAMALLAFQGDGNTHQSGDSDYPEFQRAVSKGWAWLLKEQDADGNFFKQGNMHHRLYAQAQATIALCELYGMSKDSVYRVPAEKAMKYAVKAQDKLGGWRYQPGIDSDTSVTGWFVMALQSARMADLEVPDDTLNRVSSYLDKAGKDGGRFYAYTIDGPTKKSMTAEGLLCRQYLGWKQNDPRLIDGIQYLTNNLMKWDERDAYYWYYATQACHHMEGEAWKKWNGVMRQMLPEKQVKKGAEAGSWDPNGDQWGASAGRLYVTCLHLYMLEVYYRHLPIYTLKSMKTHGN